MNAALKHYYYNVTFNHNLTRVGISVGFGVTGCFVGLGCSE